MLWILNIIKDINLIMKIIPWFEVHHTETIYSFANRRELCMLQAKYNKNRFHYQHIMSSQKCKLFLCFSCSNFQATFQLEYDFWKTFITPPQTILISGSSSTNFPIVKIIFHWMGFLNRRIIFLLKQMSVW